MQNLHSTQSAMPAESAPPKCKSRFLSPRGLALLGVLVAAGFYGWTEHRAYLLGVLPYLFFLICPLMHFFMHRGHDKHEASSEQRQEGHAGHGEAAP